MAFSPIEILAWLPEKDANFHVAYSGGMDSHILLHAMASLKDSGSFKGQLRAIHINHGLNPNADIWAAHCQKVCAQLDVPIDVVTVKVQKQKQGPEHAAREARYRAFAEALNPGDYLLTAHHQDDQVETQLFRMMRGTGIRGLAGIHSKRPFAKGTLLRPFLRYTRGALLAYAEQENLDWIEDDSNSDEALDRNFLRHRVVPELASRWPGYRKNLQRLAELADESQILLEAIGAEDLQQVRDGIHRISIPGLLAYSPERQRNILRSWFLALDKDHGIPVPDFYVIDRILKELVPAAQDGEPVVEWQKEGQKTEVRRFTDKIYLVVPVPAQELNLPLTWHTEIPLQLPGLGALSLVESDDGGFLLPAGANLEIRFRKGGEAAKPAGRKTRSLKKILQDYQVPPWLRNSMPLIYDGDDLVAVGDLFVTDQSWVQKRDPKGKKIYRIQWHRPELHCGY